MQAKVADILLRAVIAARRGGIDLRVVAETHSETIVNRIGHHIATGSASAENVRVVLFERQEGETAVRFAEYDEDGYLKNWPFGFFEPEEHTLL